MSLSKSYIRAVCNIHDVSENIYDEKKKRIEDVIQLLEKGLENLTPEELRRLRSELPLVISELPEVTRTGIEKRKLMEVMRMIMEDAEKSREGSDTG